MPARLCILVALAVLLGIIVIWQFTGSEAESEIQRHERDGNVEALVEIVQTSEPEQACKAIRAMGNIGPKSLRPLRKILLEDTRPETRVEAAVAMGQIIEEVPDRKQTAALTTAVVEDKSPEVRAAAASSLGKTYACDDMETLLKAMDDADPDVRRRAHYAVSRIFGRTYDFDPNWPRERRLAVIKLISEAWPKHKAVVARYHKQKKKPPKP